MHQHLDVKVFNGIAPNGIEVSVKKVGGTFKDEFNSPLSFSKTYTDLEKGNYIVLVTGLNPQPGGSITVELTGDFTKGPTPGSPQTQDTSHFSILYGFVI